MSKHTMFTIGFTKKTAEQFFEILLKQQVTLVADVRLNNTGQLAGYTKAKDLAFFLSLVGIRYEHWANFAPTKQLRDSYHTTKDFDEYARAYSALLAEREAVERLPKTLPEDDVICLLCSEDTPDKCHRRLAAELIAGHLGNVEIRHL